MRKFKPGDSVVFERFTSRALEAGVVIREIRFLFWNYYVIAYRITGNTTRKTTIPQHKVHDPLILDWLNEIPSEQPWP